MISLSLSRKLPELYSESMASDDKPIVMTVYQVGTRIKRPVYCTKNRGFKWPPIVLHVLGQWLR
jgi:hypothetical protein